MQNCTISEKPRLYISKVIKYDRENIYNRYNLFVSLDYKDNEYRIVFFFWNCSVLHVNYLWPERISAWQSYCLFSKVVCSLWVRWQNIEKKDKKIRGRTRKTRKIEKYKENTEQSILSIYSCQLDGINQKFNEFCM